MLFLAACPCIAACGHRMVSLRVIQGRKVEWNRHDWISGHGETRSLALPVVYVTNSCIRYPALVVQSCPALCNPMSCSTSGFPVLRSWSLLKFMSLVLTMPSNHLILCHPLFLLPSAFPSTRVYSSESALHIRWPKHWSFSFSISLSNLKLRTIKIDNILWKAIQFLAF